MKNKLLLFILTVLCVLSFCAFFVGCNNDTSSNTAEQSTEQSTSAPVDNPQPSEPSNPEPETPTPIDEPQQGEPTAPELPITTVKNYLSTLTKSLTAKPSEYIPDAMLDGFTANLVTENQIVYDFSDFVSINSIKYGGFGKQWNMVVDNLRQSEIFYKSLNVGEGVLSAAFDTIKNYLDSANVDTINKSFDKNNFSAEISYNNNKFICYVEYKTAINNSFFGNVSPKLSMTYDTVNQKSVFDIIFTSTNRVRYEVENNRYALGIEYGVNAASRTSYLSVERKNNKVEGHIYEYITVKGKDVLPSCADFYIENGYVSVIGNKADAMMVTKGYINELYKANEGKLLGYEVRETAAGVTYNTLWFNLNDISGINSIKIGDKTQQNNSSKSTNDVYLNGSAALFSPTYNKKLGVKTSRKYDIEFRTQYFYSKNAKGEIIEHAVEVPMMFIQENNDKDTNFTDYPNDVKKDNGITSSVILNQAYLNKILIDYDLLVNDFINNKKEMSSTEIKTFMEN